MIPVIMFWIIEGLQASHMKIMELRVAELEKLWLSDESEVATSTDLLFYGSHQYQSSKSKIQLICLRPLQNGNRVSFLFTSRDF